MSYVDQFELAGEVKEKGRCNVMGHQWECGTRMALRPDGSLDMGSGRLVLAQRCSVCNTSQDGQTSVWTDDAFKQRVLNGSR